MHDLIQIGNQRLHRVFKNKNVNLDQLSEAQKIQAQNNVANCEFVTAVKDTLTKNEFP